MQERRTAEEAFVELPNRSPFIDVVPTSHAHGRHFYIMREVIMTFIGNGLLTSSSQGSHDSY